MSGEAGANSVKRLPFDHETLNPTFRIHVKTAYNSTEQLPIPALGSAREVG